MRLIDADKLVEKLRKRLEWMEETFGNGDFQRGCKTATSVILRTVENTSTCKTVDAEPVRNGHWTETLLIMRDKNGDFIVTPENAIRCSECFRTFDMKKLWARNFCPGCGTKMDEQIEVLDDDSKRTP